MEPNRADTAPASQTQAAGTAPAESAEASTGEPESGSDKEARPSVPPADGESEQGASRDGLLLKSMRRLFRRENGSARADIEDVLLKDELSGAAFSPEERLMLRNILRLSSLRVDDVMVPRADIDALQSEMPLSRALTAFRAGGHSRMPVYHDTLDDPIGMVHIKDLMAWITDRAKTDDTDVETPRLELGKASLDQTLRRSGMIRPILFVPPSMSARALLEKMQASRTQMALVIDEYGGTDGLVSLEDLVETIVGDIEDEHDTDAAARVRRVDAYTFLADARASIADSRSVIGEDFARLPDVDEEEVDTIGGLVFTIAGRVPIRGELIAAPNGYEFEILDGDPRRIKRVRIRRRRKGRSVRLKGQRDAARSGSQDTGAAA